MPTDSLTIDEAATWITRSDLEWGTTTVTYSFPTSMPDDYSWADGFEAFNSDHQAAVELAFDLWSDVCGLTFVEAGPGEVGDIRFFAFDMVDEEGDPLPGAAYGNYPEEGCSVRFNTNASAFDNMAPGESGFETLLHEIGHALGLSHPGNYDAGQGATYDDDAEYIQDSEQYTLMSYFGASNTGADFNGNSQLAPMLHDIAAVEQMYGDNPDTRDGNTTYGFNSNSDRIIHRFDETLEINGDDVPIRDIPIFTIYDSGGTDTIDLSGYASDEAQRLDLNQMAFSDIGGMVNNISIARYTEIENAVGGAGADDLFGENGDDLLIGGAGGDVLNGGANTDTASYADSNARVVINLGLGYAASGHAAGDSFVSIERVIGSAFNDRIVADAGGNALWGGAGNDELTGGAGNDELFGEGGGDLFVFNAGDGDDEIGDFLVGADFLVLNGITIDSTSELDGNGDAVMDTLAAFSSGDSVLLAGVTGIVDAGDLIA